MVSKDQGIGATILVVALAIIVFYIWWLFLAPFMISSLATWEFQGWSFQELAVVIPVLIIVLAVFAIAAWIGYTMATTPPPKPLEEIPELSGSVESKEAGQKK